MSMTALIICSLDPNTSSICPNTQVVEQREMTEQRDFTPLEIITTFAIVMLVLAIIGYVVLWSIGEDEKD